MFLIYKKDSLILATIIAIGIVFRLYNLDAYSIFFDEKSTMVVSQGLVLDGSNQKDIFLAPTFTPAQFWSEKTLADYYEAMTRSDIGNSPFYYLLLHFWMKIFGMSDFVARLFSVVFSLLIIGGTYLFSRSFFTSRTGLIAASLVAIDPFFIAYSQQARTYSLTFFLTLTATYLFLKIIEDQSRNHKSLYNYIGYVLAAGLGLLSHFLTISVLIAHGIYALCFLRTFNGWIKLVCAGILTISGLIWWLLFGGGQWTLFSLNEQAKLYRRMAETNGLTFGEILPATVQNVFIKSLPVFSDLVIFTNGLTEALEGKKNVTISITVGFLLIAWYRYGNKIQMPKFLYQSTPYLLILLSLIYYNNHRTQFGILSVGIFALSFVFDLHKQADPLHKKRLWLLYIMTLVPTLFLILMSFKNGHTYGIMQRYSGFSFPYVIILTSLLIQYYFSLSVTFRSLILLFMVFQFYFVGMRLNEYYQDKSISYGYLGKPRVGKNPFHAAARKINNLYQKGDIIIYPAKPNLILTELDRNFSNYRMRDAQLTNLYLPKNATFIQKVDTTESDRILIKRKKEVLEIINLKGLRAGDD